MALGPILAGFLWTYYESYTWAVLLSFGLSLVGVISIFALPRTDQQLIPDWDLSIPHEARTSA